MANVPNFQNLYDTLIQNSDRAWQNSEVALDNSLGLLWQERAEAFEWAAHLVDQHCALDQINIKTTFTMRFKCIDAMRQEEAVAEFETVEAE